MKYVHAALYALAVALAVGCALSAFVGILSLAGWLAEQFGFRGFDVVLASWAIACTLIAFVIALCLRMAEAAKQ